MNTSLRVLIVLIAVWSTMSCAKREEALPTVQTNTTPVASSPTSTQPPLTASPASSPAAPTTAQVIASGEYTVDPTIRADLLEVRRVSGGALLIKWRTVNTSDKQGNYNFDWPELYYIDPAENKKYFPLTDSEGQRILDVYWGDMAAGSQRGNWAKFPAPPATSTRISVSLPNFPPMEDVPVAQ